MVFNIELWKNWRLPSPRCTCPLQDCLIGACHFRARAFLQPCSSRGAIMSNPIRLPRDTFLNRDWPKTKKENKEMWRRLGIVFSLRPLVLQKGILPRPKTIGQEVVLQHEGQTWKKMQPPPKKKKKGVELQAYFSQQKRRVLLQHRSWWRAGVCARQITISALHGDD